MSLVLSDGLSEAVIGGLIGGLIIGLLWGLVEGFKANIQTQVQPNQGILNSGRNTLVLLGIAIPITVFLFRCLPWLLTTVLTLDNEQISVILGTAIVALFFGICIFGGGQAYLRHYTLRFVLARSGKIPYLYANFLNYCTERLLLQRVGGRFRFLHRTLQEHFAAMPLDDYGRNV